jgi:hypothetical protein
MHRGSLVLGFIAYSLIEFRINTTRRVGMSLSTAELYGRLARDAGSARDLGENVKCAVDELIKAIKELEHRVWRLESQMRHL